MRLLGVVGHVPKTRPAGGGADGFGASRVPVAEQPLGLRDEIIPVDPAGDRDDRAGRPHVRRHERPHRLNVDPLDVGGDALARHAPGAGVVKLPQRRHGAVRRIVLRAGEILQHHLPGIFELVFLEPRSPQDVGVDWQGRRQLSGDHRAGKTGMARRYRLRPLHAGSLEGLDDLSAAAIARSAEHHFAGERGQTAAAGAVVNGARRGMKRDGDGFKTWQLLAEQHDAVVESC